MVEQHDRSAAERGLGRRPAGGFLDFVRDVPARDTRHDDVASRWVPDAVPS